MPKNKSQKNIPNDWKQKKVEDIFEFVSTCSHSKAQMSYDVDSDESVYNIHYGDIHTKYLKYIDLSKNNVPFLINKDEIFKKEKFLNIGDLVIVDASEDYEGVGSSVEIKNLANKKCVAGLHTFALRDKNNLTADGYRALLFRNEKVHNWLKRVSVYSKIYGITKASLQKTYLLLPPLPEQNRIVAIFEIWDGYLKKLSRKIEIKKNIKKGLMALMMNCELSIVNGKKVYAPKLRLPGFSGEWKYKKISQIAKTSSGGTPKSTEKEYYRNGSIPWLKSGEIRIGKINSFKNFITENGLKKSSAKLFPINTVLVAMYGVTAGQCGILKKEASTNQAICGILPNRKYSSDYLYCFFTTQIDQLLKMGTGAAQPNISQDIIKNYDIILPPLKKQTAIAKILTTADQEIETLEKKKKIIEEQKKYLLNNLVTGKIRAPEKIKIT